MAALSRAKVGLMPPLDDFMEDDEDERSVWPRLILALSVLAITVVVVYMVLLAPAISASASAAGGCGGG
jgi:hypothetical protein